MCLKYHTSPSYSRSVSRAIAQNVYQSVSCVIKHLSRLQLRSTAEHLSMGPMYFTSCSLHTSILSHLSLHDAFPSPVLMHFTPRSLILFTFLDAFDDASQRPFADMHWGTLLGGLMAGTLALDWPEGADPTLVKVGRACMSHAPNERPTARVVCQVSEPGGFWVAEE